MATNARPLAVIGGSGLLLLLTLVGCGDGRPSRVHVSGRVTIDGKPLPFGFIQFRPADQRAASGIIGPDGRFRLTTFNPDDGCVIGTHRVTVEGREDKGSSAVIWHAPKKYADVNTSGVELEITGPTDKVDIKLTWDGGKPFIEKLDGKK